MNDIEKYEFDRLGYVVIKDMLTSEQVTSLAAAIDELEEHALANIQAPPRKQAAWGQDRRRAGVDVVHRGIGASGDQFEFDLASEFASCCKVYFSTSNTLNDFSETLSLREHVAVGDNKISFVLQPPASGCPLRLDPIACAGHFVLSNLRVSEIIPEQSGASHISNHAQ